jgi:hypothetical protein
MDIIKDAAAGACLLYLELSGTIVHALGMVEMPTIFWRQFADPFAWFLLYLFVRIRDRVRADRKAADLLVNPLPVALVADEKPLG